MDVMVYIIVSGENIRLTKIKTYDGNPSISPDGTN